MKIHGLMWNQNFNSRFYYRIIPIFMFLIFIRTFLTTQLFAQPEVMAWGNLTGIRVDGQLLGFESSIRVVGKGWLHLNSTGKEKQQPKYNRENLQQTVNTSIGRIRFSEVVDECGRGCATVSVIALVISTFNWSNAIEPANPKTSPEARALLDLFYRISGKYTLTGQHNDPNSKDLNSRFAAKYIGQTPAIWSSDMGFAKDGDLDSYLARPDIVKEAIRQHKKGSIITICWHAVPPTAEEPVTFQPQRPVAPDSLSSIQGRLTDSQFKEVLTPGTRLYKQWAKQVDSVAVYLKKLQEAMVPVLWRPYHEMNGDWFWWGGRVGEKSTIDLYRQLYDRLVNFHKLNNLIWIWNVDRPTTPIRKFSNFYPGNEYLDILSLDVYGSDFNQNYYDSLLVLSKGKPIVLGEVGNPPTIDIINNQPKWASWVIWAGMVRNLTKKQHQELVNNPRILSREDSAYWEVMAPLRKACGLPLLPLKVKYPVNYSGQWVFNEAKSDVGKIGTGNVPGTIEIDQDDDLLHVKKLLISEWGDDQITNEEILLDGTEIKSVFFHSPRISKANWDKDSNLNYS